MRSLTRSLLWLFVMSVPWELVVLPGTGAVSRLFGLAAMGAGALTIALERRIRRPGLIFWVAAAFTFSSFLSLLWTVSYAATLDRVFTYAQLLALVLLVPEFARTKDEQQSLLVAICVGAFVPTFDLLRNFRAGVEVAEGNRYSSSSVNANDLGLTLALGIPMAWHLMMHARRSVRLMAGLYLPLAPIGILLTGTRGAFLSALVALTIVPLTLRRLSARAVAGVTVVVAAALVSVAVVVPAESWERIFTIKQEIGGEGTMTGRMTIWAAGWRVFMEHPTLGVGAGAFQVAVDPYLPVLVHQSRSPHNAGLAVLVEQGVVGFAVFVAMLIALAWAIARLPPPDRRLWGVVMLAWLVGVMSVGWQHRKFTWLLFALVAAARATTDTWAERNARTSAAKTPVGFTSASGFDLGVTHARTR